MDDAVWTGIATEISEALESTSAVLKLHGADDDIRLLEHTDNLLVSDDRQSWATDWHKRDLWVARSARFGVSRIVTDHDLVSPAEQRQSGFYQEWLRALDIFYMVGAVFPGGDGALGVLGIHRPARAGAYADKDRHNVSILLPHLQRAFWLSGQFSKAAAHRLPMKRLSASMRPHSLWMGAAASSRRMRARKRCCMRVTASRAGADVYDWKMPGSIGA